jgi:predicted phage-related endonuclease
MNVAYIPVFKVSFGIKECMYVVERDVDIQELIIDRTRDFWENNVLKQVEPEGAELPSLESLKGIARVPNKLAEVPTPLVEKWLDLKAKSTDYDKQAKSKFQEILALLKDAEGAMLEGNRLFTFYSQGGAPSVDKDLMKSKYPKAFAECVKPSSHRVARVSKLK